MRLFLACAVSAAIVLAAPFMGRLQSLLRESISTRAYVVLLGAVVAGAVLTAIVVAFTRIKAHRGRRIAAMAAAIALAVAYTSVLSTGIPEIDAVERVHFVEYGLIAVLFYRVLASGRGRLDHPAADPLRLHCRHARRVAAVVHSVSRRRDA